MSINNSDGIYLRTINTDKNNKKNSKISNNENISGCNDYSRSRSGCTKYTS